MKNIDDYLDDIEKFELEGATKLSPIEFARHMNMKPQLVYYYIRTGVVEAERCECGRRIVDVEASKKALQAKKKDRGTA